MKRIFFSILTLMLVVGCQSTIELQEAIDIATSNAGVSDAAIVESSSYNDDDFTIIFTDNGYRYTYVVDEHGEIESFNSQAIEETATSDATQQTPTTEQQATTSSNTGTILDYVSQDVLDKLGIDTSLIENYSVREETDDGKLYRKVTFTINNEKYEFEVTSSGLLAQYEYETTNGNDGDLITSDDAKTIAIDFMGVTSDQVTWYDVEQDDDYQYELEGLFGEEVVDFEIYYNGQIGKIDYESR